MFAVTTTADGGDGSLRQAVLDANATAEEDFIVLPAGTYTLTRTGAGEDQAATGDLDLRAPVWLIGEGASSSIIDAGGIDRVFHVHAGVSATFFGVTVRGGRVDRTGGGLFLAPNSSLYLYESAVTNNRAEAGPGLSLTPASGGGIHADNAFVLLWRSTVSDNVAAGRVGQVTPPPVNQGGPAQGGALSAVGGTLVLAESTVSGNRATGGTGRDGVGSQDGGRGGAAFGGGLAASAAVLVVVGCDVLNNQAAGGAGGIGGGPFGSKGFGLPGGERRIGARGRGVHD